MWYDANTSSCTAEVVGMASERALGTLENDITLAAAHLDAALCGWLLDVAEFNRRDGWEGCRSMAEWLNWRCGIALRTARDHVRVGEALSSFSKIRDAFAHGEISYSKVRAITRIATPETEDDLLMWA